ncbi:MAG: outer membrane lipoprotein-sorting protein [Chthoniobacterales bacterium]
MKLKARLPILLVLCLTSASVSAAPSAQEILASVRLQQAQQEIDLQGQLRQEALVVPFRLTQNGSTIRYSFANPVEALQLKLGEKDSRLEEITRSGVDKISGPEFDQKVRGTAVTYEDLALKFLYWPDGHVLGEETVRTRKCWKLQLKPPSRDSQYSNVLLWVDEQGGALMRLQGYDWNGKLAKRFEVESAQKIEGRWFLKSMRIEALDPETGKVRTRTYLEIRK